MVDPSDVMAGRILTLVREVRRIIMRLVVIIVLRLRPKPFFSRRTCLVRVFTNRARDHRIRHGRGICVPTHRSYRTFVVVRASSGEFNKTQASKKKQ